MTTLETDTPRLAAPDAPARVRRLPELPRRLVLAAAIVAVVMLPVGLFLSVIGIALLEAFGGAANDTSMVVVIAAFVVTDFWGGGILQALTKARSTQVTFAWGIARGVLLLAVAFIVTKYALVIPVQFLLALPAAWAGSRASRKQAQLKAQVEAQRAEHMRVQTEQLEAQVAEARSADISSTVPPVLTERRP